MNKPVALSSSAEAWRDVSGQPITCSEKIRLLNEALDEVLSAAQNAMDDAVLMGCSRDAFQRQMQLKISGLQPKVKERCA